MRLRDTGSLTVVCGMPSVSTALRVKPAAARSKRSRRSAVPVLRGGQTSRYVVDAVLGDTASQQQVYQALVSPLVDSFIQGENVVLLAYGAASTGKSYTLQGATDMGSLSVTGEYAGIILRATQAILQGLSIVPKAKYCLSVAYCGLSVGHDAQLLDLLTPAPGAAAVSLRDGSAAAALAGLTCWSVEDPCDVLEALRSRKLLHSSGGTMAKAPKRSMHSMLTLQLDSYAADGTLLQRNTLSFVELAAPEPKDPLNPRGGSGMESASARSLAVAYSTLSKVLSALRNTSAGTNALGQPAAAGTGSISQQQLLQHVPWRDSPLTRWLQEQLHAANAILVLGTISTEIEAATDCLTTVSWVSRFSAASRSGGDGVIVSFVYEALTDPEGAAGCYLRFQPDPQEDAVAVPQAATAQGSCVPDPCSAMCSSPMAKLGSPNLQFCESAASPRSGRPRSAGSVCQLAPRWPQDVQGQQLVRRPESPLRGSINLHPWHREQLQQQQQASAQLLRSSVGAIPVAAQHHHHHHQQQQPPQHQAAEGYQRQSGINMQSSVRSSQGTQNCLVISTGAGAGQEAAAAAAGNAPTSPAAAADALDAELHQQQHQQQCKQQQQQQVESEGDEVLLYGELMSALRRAGGNLRAEAILEQLLQELGAARAELSAERGEGRAVRARLEALEAQHADCDSSRKLLQDQVQELQQQLDASRKSLKEASGDRDLFLRRLQQLELEGHGGSEGNGPGGSNGPGGVLEQRQKAHAAQLRMMEAELNALASSNQQLRSQLELSAQQASSAGREKLAAQDAAAEVTGRLQQRLTAAQQELDMLRAAADIEGTVRKEMEATVEQLRRACSKANNELAAVSEDRANLHEQHQKAQESIDALVAELQDTLARLEQEQKQAGLLSDKLQQSSADAAAKQQQLTSLQTMVQQLEQQKQQLAEAASQHQTEVETLARLLQDLQLVYSDFELDLEAALPQHWQQLLQGSTADASSISPHSIKLRSRLLSLLDVRSSRVGGGSSRPGSPRHARGASYAVDVALGPSAWAGKLQGVVEVLELVGQERGHVTEALQAAQQRVQLLETNVQELQKLVATQENLQQQLAAQIDLSNVKSGSHQQELQQLSEQLRQTEQQLQDVQDAMAAVVGKLQESEAALAAAESEKTSLSAQLSSGQTALADRDAALDALADELVAVSGLCDEQTAAKEQAEEQVVNLASELEGALTRLSTREQLLEQVWSQLTGITGAAAATGAAQGQDDSPGRATTSILEPKSSIAAALGRTEQLQRLRQQQKHRPSYEHSQQQQQQSGQQQQPAVAGLARRLSATSDTAAAGLAQQAVAAAVRRNSQCSDGRESHSTDATASRAHRLQQHQQQQQHWQQQHNQKQELHEVQGLVMDAVHHLRQQVTGLQQELQAAQTGRRDREQELLQRVEQLQQLQQLHAQQHCDLQQVQDQKQRLQAEVVSLGQHLLVREQELRQAQLNCQDLDAALRELQRQMCQQQQQLAETQHHQQTQQQRAGSDPPAPITPHTTQKRLDQAELQLADCRKQLVEAKTAAAEAAGALAGERAARVAAEDRDASRQGLMERLTALQAEVEGLHAALLQEKRAVVALRDELSLMITSRDTWRDAAKRAEVKLQDSQAAVEQRSTELIRARAEILQLRQELEDSSAQLLLVSRAQGAANSTAGDADAARLQDSLAARLATAQVLKREAEDRAAELSRKLATAQARLAQLQQQADDSEADMGTQLYQAQAQLVRAKADLAASRAAAAVAAIARNSEVSSHNTATLQQSVAAAGQPKGGPTLPGKGCDGQLSQQQQQLSDKAPAGAERQRSVAAQLETAEQLMRSMRATAAAALSDTLSAGPSQLSIDSQPPGAAADSSYRLVVGAESTSPFKAWSGAVSSSGQQQHQEDGAEPSGGCGGSSSKPASPKGWLYNKLFATKDRSSCGRGGQAAAASSLLTGGDSWSREKLAADTAEAPCLY